MRLDLVPIFQDVKGLKPYLQTNFRRIEELFKVTETHDAGEASVTGELQITTKLKIVRVVVVSLADDPSYPAGLVVAKPHASVSTDIVVRVFRSGWDIMLSTQATRVMWMAVGA